MLCFRSDYVTCRAIHGPRLQPGDRLALIVGRAEFMQRTGVNVASQVEHQNLVGRLNGLQMGHREILVQRPHDGCSWNAGVRVMAGPTEGLIVLGTPDMRLNSVAECGRYGLLILLWSLKGQVIHDGPP